MTGHLQSPWSDPLSFKDKSFKTHNISKCQQQMLQNIKDSVSPIECNSRIGNLMQEQNWMNSEKTFCLTQHHHCIDHCAWELVWSWSISHLVFFFLLLFFYLWWVLTLWEFLPLQEMLIEKPCLYPKTHTYTYNLLQFPAKINTSGNTTPTTFILFTHIMITEASYWLIKINFLKYYVR